MTQSSGLKKILVSLSLLAAVFIVGIFGYSIIEGYGLIDSLFMIMITISTVGYGTLGDLSAGGKIFTSLVILTSITIVVYATSNITAFIVEGRINQLLRRRLLLKSIEKLRDHYIVIGAGDLGYTIANEMRVRQKKVVLIDKDENRLKELHSKTSGDLLYVVGDATDEATLKSASIDVASGLVACLPEDVENIFVVLTARGMNDEMTIISKVNHGENINKLKYAGATNVIPIQEIGAHRMVSMILNPTIIGFLDSISQSGSLQLRFEEVNVPVSFPAGGLTLETLKIPQKIGLIVIATVSAGANKFNPSASTLVKPGDSLMVLGSHAQVEKLGELLEEIAKTQLNSQQRNSF